MNINRFDFKLQNNQQNLNIKIDQQSKQTIIRFLQ